MAWAVPDRFERTKDQNGGLQIFSLNHTISSWCCLSLSWAIFHRLIPTKPIWLVLRLWLYCVQCSLYYFPRGKKDARQHCTSKELFWIRWHRPLWPIFRLSIDPGPPLTQIRTPKNTYPQPSPSAGLPPTPWRLPSWRKNCFRIHADGTARSDSSMIR